VLSFIPKSCAVLAIGCDDDKAKRTASFFELFIFVTHHTPLLIV
jgi:hypothetical protein